MSEMLGYGLTQRSAACDELANKTPPSSTEAYESGFEARQTFEPSYQSTYSSQLKVKQ